MNSHPFFILLLILICQACGSNTASTTEQDLVVNDSINTPPTQTNIFQDPFEEKQGVQQLVFPYVLDSTFYKHPDSFLLALGDYYQQEALAQTTITAFEQQTLQGFPDSVWFVNCQSTVATNDSCAFPMFHTQYIFNHKGNLIHKGKAVHAQFLPMMEDSICLYMTVDHDCEGNGQHHFYAYEHGQLIDIFNVLMNQTPKTYDANPEGGMFQKNQLNLIVQDIDQDGHQDIMLKGKWLVLESPKGKKYTPSYPFKRNPINYTFLYKPAKEYFLQMQ